MREVTGRSTITADVEFRAVVWGPGPEDVELTSIVFVCNGAVLPWTVPIEALTASELAHLKQDVLDQVAGEQRDAEEERLRANDEASEMMAEREASHA